MAYITVNDLLIPPCFSLFKRQTIAPPRTSWFGTIKLTVECTCPDLLGHNRGQ